jgi:hypothetical protein
MGIGSLKDMITEKSSLLKLCLNHSGRELSRSSLTQLREGELSKSDWHCIEELYFIVCNTF